MLRRTLWRSNDASPASGGDSGTPFAIMPAIQAFNVKDGRYGAKGNGITDDAPAFAAAFAAANAVGGGIVSVPSGTYRIASTLVVPSNIVLVASGLGSRITSDVDNVHLFHVDGGAHIVFQDLHLSSTAATPGDGIRCTDATDVLIRDCYGDGPLMGVRVTGTGASAFIRVRGGIYENCVESGVLFHRAFDCWAEGVTSNDNGSTNQHHGFYISDATSRRCELRGCYASGNAGSGAQLSGQLHAVLGGCYEANGTNGVVTFNASRCALTGIRALSNVNRGIYVAACDHMTIDNPMARLNGMSGIDVENSRYWTITGGAASENVQHGILINGGAGGTTREGCITGTVCIDNDSADTNTYDGVALQQGGGACVRISVDVVARISGATGQRYGVSIGAGCLNNTILGGQLVGNKTGPILDNGSDTIIMGVQGSGGLTAALALKSGAYTFTPLDGTIVATSGTWALTLPLAAGLDGRVFGAKNIGAGDITLTPSGADTIDGVAVLAIGNGAFVQSDGGTRWIVIASV